MDFNYFEHIVFVSNLINVSYINDFNKCLIIIYFILSFCTLILGVANYDVLQGT